jgi:hypothetical protein
MDTFSDLISDLGGSAAVANRIGLPAGHVRQWRKRNSIPPHYWHDIVDVAKKQGKREVTVTALVDLAKARPRPKVKRKRARAA